MLKGVSVLIPYKPDHSYRDNLFKWVKRYYQNVIPDVELCIGESQSEPFNRSQAINIAAKKATKDVFVIADADVIYDPEILIQAIQMLDKHAWIIPYNNWLDLSNSSTDILLKSSPQWPLSIKVNYTDRFKNLKNSIPISGVVVVTRENFNIVKGFDERFVGWGYEDNAFETAMNTLCGPYKRLDNHFLYHLWHPRVGRTGNPNIRNNKKLYKRYAKSKGNVKEMKKLINEQND